MLASSRCRQPASFVGGGLLSFFNLTPRCAAQRWNFSLSAGRDCWCLYSSENDGEALGRIRPGPSAPSLSCTGTLLLCLSGSAPCYLARKMRGLMGRRDSSTGEKGEFRRLVLLSVLLFDLSRRCTCPLRRPYPVVRCEMAVFCRSYKNEMMRPLLWVGTANTSSYPK